MASGLVWVITGTSTGLGRELALAALKRGDKVIATARARSFEKIGELKEKGADVLELDVTAPLEELKIVAKRAVDIHGRVDVVVNNAGYLIVGTVEECTPQETLDQFNTNVFGCLNVTRAFLPYMRARRKGAIVFMGSVGGWIGSPASGLYCINRSLHAEISPLGLRSICFNLGGFRTPFLTPDHYTPYESRIVDYVETATQADESFKAISDNQPGDPTKCVEVIIDIVRGEGVARGKGRPIEVELGSDVYSVVKKECENTLQKLSEWEEASLSTDIADQ
ncbi:hypothetical protein F5887DRAFT_1065473 [Amanita rubescens]|nr:hypothetical protein F5887DRAFT_1065473 [Amanita rubescens]